MGMIMLIIGSVMTLLFIVFLLAGQKYNYMIDVLQGDEYPLKSIYAAGLAMQDIGLFKLNGKFGAKIKDSTKLLYERKYSEFYARIAWAQGLSFGLFCGALCFTIGGMLSELAPLMGLVGVIMLIFPCVYFANRPNEMVGQRRAACETEFPNAIAKLALIVNSGVILHDAWKIVANGNKGEFYSLMQDSCKEMENGKSDIDAIYEFGVKTNSNEIKKFASSLIQSIERGGGELPGFLSTQSRELWQHHRQVMLQKGEKAAGALLMPIALMFVGVMLIVIVAAMQNFGT